MRYIILLTLTFLISRNCVYAQRSLQKLWQSDSTTVKGPESVLFDPISGTLLISSMNSGEVFRMTTAGKINPKPLAAGLQSNKGSAIYHGLFYTAETSGVAVVDLSSGKILKRIPVPGAVMLNDLAVDDRGIVFVSDTRTGKVYRIDGDKVTLYLQNLPGANGLLALGSDLYVLTSTAVFKVDSQRKMMALAEGFESGLDGIVRISEAEFIVSNYHGILYLLTTNGDKDILLDTRSDSVMSNDISYDPATKTLYAPAFRSNCIIAYHVN